MATIDPLIAHASIAKEAWDILQTTYSSKSHSRIFSLRDTLTNVKRDSRSISNYMREIKSTADDLACNGSPIYSEELVIKVLSDLDSIPTPLITDLVNSTTPHRSHTQGYLDDVPTGSIVSPPTHSLSSSPSQDRSPYTSPQPSPATPSNRMGSMSRDSVNWVENDTSSDLWHRRMSHMSEKGIDSLAKKNLLSGVKQAKYWREKGIRHQKTPPKTPQLNGLVERMNRTLVERVRCMLSDANMSDSFWAEALNTVAYVINLSHAVALDCDVPDRVWTGKNLPKDRKALKNRWVFQVKHEDDNTVPRIQKLKKELSKYFAMKDLGPARQIHGMQIVHDRKAKKLVLSQEKYIQKDANSVSTPLSTSDVLSLYDGSFPTDTIIYRQVIGLLQYLSFTRLDTCFAVNKLAQFQSSLSAKHLQATKRLLRYLKDTITYGLHFKHGNSSQLLAYSDADWDELRVKMPCPPKVLCDNIGVTYMCRNPVFHNLMKHFAINSHFVRNQVESRQISVHHIPTGAQLANALTKALPKRSFVNFVSNIGLKQIEPILRWHDKDVEF
ncbi:uncharacterized protein [Solanum lycopersicum]|uniref:uncharacterized protein n=1 Tax=Solanum lycopersicum TaxID=4081 RepID=UPI00374A3A38